MNGEPGWSKHFAQFSKPIVHDGEQKERSHQGFFFPLKLLIVLYALNVLCVGSPYYFSPREK